MISLIVILTTNSEKAQTMTRLSNKIIDLRESKDLSQAELVRLLAFNKSVMNRIGSGKRKISSEELKNYPVYLMSQQIVFSNV